MIRTARVGLLGKNYLNSPLFTQRAVILPKQIFLEFSVVANNAEADQKEKKLMNRQFVDEYREFFGEIKYSYLKDFFQTGLQKGHASDSAVRDFFDRLPAFTPPEVIKVLKLITETNTRPLLCIKALCALLLAEEKWKYTVKECADLLYCMSRLSYRDHKLIKLIADQLLQFKDYHSPKTAGFMLHSLADLKFRNCELLERLLKYILDSSPTIKPMLHCMRAASILNYCSSEVDQMIEHLSKLKEVDFMHSSDYVDFIWACIILNKQNSISMDHIVNILSKDYVERLVGNGVHNSLQWKLLNINAAAKQMVNYNGPLLNNLSCYKKMSLSILNQRTPFLESVLDVLSHLVPKSGLVKPLVNTGAGFYLDFEFIEDVATQKNVKYSKKGIVLLNFNDICSDGTLTGFANFKLNLLTSLGYKTVTVQFSEYDQSAPLSEKIKILKTKLKNAGCKSEVLPDLKNI